MTFAQFVKAHWPSLRKRPTLPQPGSHIAQLEGMIDALDRGETLCVCVTHRPTHGKRVAILERLLEQAQTERDPDRLAAIERAVEKLEGQLFP